MNTKYIKVSGRYHVADGEIWLFNCGSSISFKAKGKGFTLCLCSLIQSGYYYVIVDRDYDNKTKLCVFERGKYECLFNDDEEHLVDIVKANEAKDNTLVIQELLIDGEFLECDHKYDKNVMIYGDSSIAGYGILSHDETSIHTSDGVRDFLYHALYELNYDMDILCASGYGLSFSAYTNPMTIGVYDYLNKVSVCSHFSWDKQNKHDILIISMGCNDASYIAEQPKRKDELVKIFINKYQNLIDREIKLNADVKILMVYGTLKEEQAYFLAEETYRVLKPLYKNLYIHKFDGDNSGAANHAYVTAHDKMAEELKTVIKTLLK